MQISEAAGGAPQPGAEPCRFPKLEECAHFHYERVQLPPTLQVSLQTSMDQSLHSQHTNEDLETEWFMVQVTSGEECWLVQRNFENFQMLDEQLHQCIFDRKISQLPDLLMMSCNEEELEQKLAYYLERFSRIADNSVNCGPVLNWLQMDNKGHRLLVPSEESRSINTPAVAAAYSVRRYVSQARDELNLEVGDMISVIDMASPGESMWWRGKRGFQVGFFPQHCVHIIGDKVPRNMPLPPPVVGSLALSPVKPVLRRHGKLITFFRSFILNRPSRRRLKQSGILKERVFGCDLGEHLLNSGRDVPTVLRSCAEFIETQGIVDGIYRLSGITSNIQKLRNAFDEDRIPDLYTEDILKDIHSVASLLKMYFRELPNPLCTYQLYQSFVNAVQGCSTATRSTETDHERLLKMREAVQKLPPPHYRTLEYLMRHLARVANHSSSTGMTTRNLAIVWAPNLLRCEALEVGGVAALQGVGVQAVVTEFLICYADLIFCDHLPSIDQPELAEKENLMAKKCRPNSLAISTPTKLITLEEARNKHLTNKSEDCNYIEVGGGPSNLPKKYHTIIELPPGARKRGHTKRSPLGWRMFFTRSSRSAPQGAVTKNRKVSTPISINDKSVTESDLTDMRRKLRTVKSAESLTSGHSEPVSTEDILGPLYSLNKPPGHNRSVSHDSYFDTLQSSQNNSEGSLLDLSEIHLNFDLEESEMRIFSEDESLVSSPRIQKDLAQRRILTRARPEDFASATNSVNPSPKKQARVVLSPESMSRKRTRLEDQLSDIQYIDCSTPDNIVSTTAVVHAMPASPEDVGFSEPKNKSPRNSDNLDNKRQSLNLEPSARTTNHPMTKSFTDLDLGRQFLAGGGGASLLTPTPTSPGYKQLGESSANTTPGYSPTLESSSSEITYQHLGGKSDGGGDSPKKAPRCGDGSPNYENILPSCGGSPNYENILTTISITYKSPPRSPAASSPMKSPVYENVILNPEKVDIPTSTASLPIQEASQPDICNGLDFLTADKPSNDRPKSLSALEDAYNSSTDSTLKANSSGAICNTSEQLSLTLSLNDQRTEASSNQSSGSNIQYTASLSSAPPYHFIENSDRLSPTDLSLSEVVQSSTENLTTSRTSISTPISPSKNSLSPNVSPTTTEDSRLLSNENLLRRDDDVWTVPRPTSINLIDFSPQEAPNSPSRTISQNDKRKSDETESYDENAIYQQVKYFRRSIHEVNALLDMDASAKTPDSVDNSVEYDTKQNTKEDHQKVEEEPNFDSLEDDGSHAYENVKGESLRHTEHLVIGPARTEDAGKTDETCKEVMREDPVEERCNVKDLKSRFEVKGTNMESGARCSIVTKDNTKPSSVPLRKTSLAESDNSDKNLDRSLTEENSLSLTSNSNTSNRVVRTSVGDKGDSDHKHHSDRSSTEPTTTNTTTTNTGSSNITSTTTSNHSRLGGSISSSNKDHSSTDEKLTDEKLATDDKLIDRSLTDDTNTSTTSSNSLNRLRVFYEKDSLPPCLRARNLKNQMKTRSLDEEEFEKECGGLDKVNERRKSLDESIGYKTNSLPKTLNQPKSLPKDENGQMESLHLSHSNEKINLLGVTGVGKEDEAQKKRERIDKYKEERRRILSEKYRSESFKEDKDVLLSRLKIYKGKEEAIEDGLKMADGERPPRSRRKSTKSESESMNETRVSEERARNSSGSSPGKNNNPAKTITPSPARSLSSLTTIPTTIIPTTNHRPPRDPELAAPVTVPKPDPPKPPKTTSSLKVRAAIFEQQNAKAAPVTVEFVRSNRASLRGEKAATTMAEVEVSKFARNSLERKKEQQERGVEKPPISRAVDKSSSIIGDKPSMISSEDIPGDLKDLEFIRHRRREDDVSKEERRRHTYETRERETDAERLRRVSLESKNSPRKEKASPTYCIKDMKAIFESKSKQ